MFDSITRFLSKSDTTLQDSKIDNTIVPLAAAMVLLEVAWADHELEQKEIQFIREVLTSLYEVNEQQVEELLQRSRELRASSTGLYEFTRSLNETLDLNEKRTLLMHLWRMNSLDKSSFHYEENMIRKISDLLHLRHSEFIQAKLAAKQVSN